MPIPTNATTAPVAPTRNTPGLDSQRLEYNPNHPNTQNLLMRQSPQLIPKPQGYNSPSGFYNVFMATAPIRDQQVLDWARDDVKSLVDINVGPNVETATDSNKRSLNNIFRPSGFLYPRANGGIPAINNDPQYLYNNPVSNVLSNAGTNYPNGGVL
jgi:hypothetical protein